MTRKIDSRSNGSGLLATRQGLALAQKKQQPKADKGRERPPGWRYERINNTSPETLAVKVSRRLDSVKAGLMKRLGLYGAIEDFSLGMFVDVLV